MRLLGTSLLVLVALATVAGCTSDADAPTKPVDELAAHDGKPCPKALPTASSSTVTDRTEKPAGSAPLLPRADAAWVCTYALPRPDGVSEHVGGWPRTDPPRRLDAAETDGLARQLNDLSPAPEDPVCSADLGRRVMVVLSWRGDLTGVVIDDFGCRTVRLTDEPFTTVPGAGNQGGAVRGELEATPTLRSSLLGAAGPG
ncbi:hypothetical protein ASD11_04050 [Aeromicrobium sp. Root495]|uniref:hypothetical protein n=1 Tax=Aeromicrobium sp. Root495 TaxID=1736550 RepID=UPI0006FC5CA7|nr:hypothetical protein [Aeromicrobium sp. Root495]KQY58815.1 hypothetical protein ASD11_04050 [Aeromicrobium sp. Root495]